MIDLKKTICIFLILSLVSCKTKNYINQNSKSYSTYDSSWRFFNLENKIEVKVVDHIKNDILCGTVAVASVTLVVDDNGKIFRVLNLCNLSDYEQGELLLLSPENKPDFNVSLPYRFYINPTTKNREQFDIDKNTLNTTFAYIEKIK